MNCSCQDVSHRIIMRWAQLCSLLPERRCAVARKDRKEDTLGGVKCRLHARTPFAYMWTNEVKKTHKIKHSHDSNRDVATETMEGLSQAFLPTSAHHGLVQLHFDLQQQQQQHHKFARTRRETDTRRETREPARSMANSKVTNLQHQAMWPKN